MIVGVESESDEDSVAAIDLDLVTIVEEYDENKYGNVKDEREKTHVGLKLVYVPDAASSISQLFKRTNFMGYHFRYQYVKE